MKAINSWMKSAFPRSDWKSRSKPDNLP
jgi:hypothetical protein